MIPKELAFEVAEYRDRLAAVRRQMTARRLDALVLFGPHNLCYVSGLDNDNLSDVQALVIPLDRDPILVLFWFEAGRAENSSWISEVQLYREIDDPIAVVAGILRQLGVDRGRLGVEQPSLGLSIAGHARLLANLPDATIENSFGCVEIPRRTKSAAEIAWMRRAAELTDRAVDAASAAISVGVTDSELAGMIAGTMYAGGGEATPLGPIVATGFRAGTPHSSFARRRVEPGDCVFLEFTAMVRRYVAPIMRTAWVGRPPADVERIAEAGAAAVEAVIGTARAGVTASDVARAGEAALAPVLDGLGLMFHHTFGYPVGIGFPPTWVESLDFLLREENHQPLQAGMTFHLPISLRRFGEVGINQSHTILVTETGAETLTRSTARLLVLDRARNQAATDPRQSAGRRD